MNLPLKSTTALGAMVALLAGPVWADMDAANGFLDTEINGLSVLSRADQEAEMQWFIDAASTDGWHGDQGGLGNHHHA